MADRNLQIVITAKDEASKQLNSLNGFLERNRNTFKSMATYGTVALASISAGITKVVKDASNFESVSMSFERTASIYGSSADQMLDALNEASAGTISNTNLMLSANKAMALGVGTSVDDLTKLLEIARMKGKALGLDTTQAFNDIVTGIGRNSPLILDNLGIITKGWAEEAEATGQAMDAQFIMNKILADGGKELESMGEAMLTPNEQFQKLKKQVSDISVQLGQVFLPIASQVLAKVSDLMAKFSEWTKENQNTIKIATIVITTIAGIITVVGTLGLILPTIITGFGYLSSAIKFVGVAIKSMLAHPILIFLAMAVAGVIYLSDKFGGLKNAFLVIGSAFAILGNLVVAGLKGLANSVIKFVNKALKVGNDIYNFFSDLLAKVGVDIGKADMSIDFEFDAEKNWGNVNAMLDMMDSMKIEAQAKKNEANSEMEELYNQDFSNFEAGELAKEKAGTDTAEKLAEASKKMGEAFKSAMDDSQQAIKETAVKVAELQQKISDLFVDKAKDDLSIRQSYAQAYVDQEAKTNDLKIQWQKETDQEKKDSLFKEYQYNLDLLEKKKTIELAYHNEVNEARRRASLSDFERQLEDLENKTTILNQEFEAKYNELQKELKAEEQKYKILNELQLWALQEADKFLAKGEKQTIDSVNRQIEYYNRLAQAVRNAQQGNYTSHASLASGTTQRANSNNATPNINITVNGDVSGQDLIDKVSDAIMGNLRNNTQLAF